MVLANRAVSLAIRAALVAMLAVVGVAVSTPQDTYAASCANTRTYCNDAEYEARYQDCNNDGNRRGSIWFSTSSGEKATNDADDGYYAQGVIVEGNDTSVTVKIRGSVWPCGSTRTGKVYAYHIKDNRSSPKLKVSSGSATLYRGNVTARDKWSSQGGSVTGTLNVAGVAPLNGKSTATETMTIPLYRCFSSVISAVSCYATDIKVRVTRIAEATDVLLRKSTARIIGTSTAGYTTEPSGLSWSTSNHWVLADGDAVAGKDYVFFLNRIWADGTAGSEYKFERARQRKIEKVSDDEYDFISKSYCPSGWTASRSSCLSGHTQSATSTWNVAPKYGYYPIADKTARSWSGGSTPSVVQQSRAGTSICERYGSKPKTIGGANSWHWGGWRCVDLAYWNLDIETHLRIDSGSWLDDDVKVVRPGQKINFRHTISNSGSQSSLATVQGRTETSGRSAAAWTSYANIGAVSTTQDAVKNNSQITVAASDAGITFCSKYAINQATNKYAGSSLTAGRGYLESWGDVDENGGKGSSLCAKVPYNYTLTPSLNVGSTTLEAGTVTSLSGIGGSIRNEKTNNNNAATNSKATDYTLRYFTTTNKQCVINNPTNYTNCSGVSGMTNLSSGSVSVLSPEGSATDSSTAFTLPTNITSVCFVLTVGKSGGEATITDDMAGAQTKSSAPSCVTLGKKPKVAITGGDVIVGRGRSGSTITSSNTTYPKNLTTPGADTATAGSWGEYSVFASGAVTNFGSGAGFANRQNTATVTSLNVGVGNLSTACQYSMLTFTNLAVGVSAASGDLTTPACSATKGNYMVQSSARPLAALLKPAVATVQTAWNSPAEGETVTRRYTSNQSIQGQNIKGTLIIAVQGNATITGNITLDDAVLKSAYTSGNFGNIPQVVIIASGNIIINEGVTRVDAWLITEGASSIIRTCNKTGGKSVGDCGSQLIVNGPVVTNKLELLRTAGAEVGQANDRGAKPAEMFNLRADAYLWARGYAMKNQSPVRTTFVKELSPRL